MFWLNVLLIVSSVLLIITILLQQRGEGLSSAFGGDGGVYYAKRGVEKAVFIATIVSAVIFLGSAFARLFF